MQIAASIAALIATLGDALGGIVPQRAPPAQRGCDHNREGSVLVGFVLAAE
jgi:hypothetical protein